MHFYKFHVSDYCADTMHLDNEHDLAYRRLLDLYYRDEKPIPLDIQQIGRRLRVGAHVLEDVLREFFCEREDGWHQARCDAALLEYSNRAATSRTNGQKGGAKKRAKRNPVGTQQVPSGYQSGTQQVPDSNPTGPCQPPSMVSGLWLSSSSEESTEVHLPTGFPKTAGQAVEMARQAGCPAPEKYLADIWEQAKSRGGRDGADVPIRIWGSHAKKRWSNEEMEWTAKQRKAAATQARPQYQQAQPDDEPEMNFAAIVEERQRKEREEIEEWHRQAGGANAA